MMSSITFALECPVCLDTLRYPVVPPCGHLICEPCIRLHVSFSTNPFEARCPTCRASFPNVLPNLSLIPNKHHVFINPPLRRVYLGDRVDNNKAVINDLKSKIVCLEARIATLESGNKSTKRKLVTVCLMLDKAKVYVQLAQDEAKKETQLALDKVNADAQLALREVEKEARLARDKANKDAQLALDKANDDLRLANLSLEECRAENNALKSQVMKSRSVGNASGQFTFNTPSKDTSPRCGNRTIKSSTKRVQLPPANQSFGYFGQVNDMCLISAARAALAVFSSSSSVAPAQSGSSTGSNMPSHATNQVTAATTSVAGESSATSNTPILDPSPTPPLLYPSPSTSPAIQPLNLSAHISLVPTHNKAL